VFRPICSITRDLVLGYNRRVSYKTIGLLLAISIFSTGCGVNIATEDIATEAPQFVTATLPPSPIPPATQSFAAPTPVPAIVPIEGTTTTQVNVRAQTSTASATLGIVNSFTKVEVIGRDASGSWYQIIYAQTDAGHGWVRAEYVQVSASAQIPIVGSATGSQPGLNGLVVQKINVRKGPATSYDSLGELNPKDVVFMTGKDSSGAWMQIKFDNSPDGSGWVALEFLQADNIDSLPVVGAPAQASQTSVTAESTPSGIAAAAAVEDGDSLQAPLATGILGPRGARRLQVRGSVSAPDGDHEDWIQFNSSTANLMVQLACSSTTLKVELWNNTVVENSFALSCGEKQLIMVTPNNNYALHVYEDSTGELHFTQYTLSLEAVE
jgi:uncharacterized protein YraI